MELENTKSLALHLIKEDLKYHQMVAGCSANNVHIEFFPDMASTVKALLNQESAGDEWEDQYVQAMGRAANITWGDQSKINTAAESLLKSLNF